MKAPSYDFLKQIGRILNSGQARTIVQTGNIYDLFCLAGPEGEEYVPLLGFLSASWDLPDLVIVIYELNGPIRFLREADSQKVRDAWFQWRVGVDANELAIKRMLATGQYQVELDGVAKAFDDSLRAAINNPTLALELLRQFCFCARTEMGGQRLLKQNLLIIIEGADMLMPEAPVHSLSDTDRHRVSICHDWFSDPGFLDAADSVVLLAESRSLLHHRIARLPQLLEVEVPAPDETARRHFVGWFNRKATGAAKVQLWSSEEDLAKFTAGLSIQALMQLLKGARHERKKLLQSEVIAKVESFIQSQLGEDIVEFKKPSHSFEDIVGFRRLKEFLRTELLPRMAASGSEAISGAAVCGPIGGGKTYIFEALAAELDMVVLVLKNIRSQWFGQTDVIFERLRRVLNALAKVLIFIDEADTQFGGVGADTHETERRLTGKLQAMMSDPTLRGRVIWLLVTARIHQLSPDLRRPGRVGDLIIPTLDPEGTDREEFLRWAVKPVLATLEPEQLQKLDAVTKGYSAAGFAALRSELKAKGARAGGSLDFEKVLSVVADQLPPAIEETRRYQTLQALVNCTRRSLLPDPKVTDEERQRWAMELRALEARGHPLTLPAMYRSLDANRIIETARVLGSRISERFPESSLSKVAQELHGEASRSAQTCRTLATPILWVRILAVGTILVMLAAAFITFLALNRKVELFSSVADFMQGLDAAVNELILFGAAIYFLLNLEGRIKRTRALRGIHVLRSMAHIIDMHQLTKDPERISSNEPNTASSPERKMTPFALTRYLDYCSEMLSLLSKIGALYVQDFSDPVTLSAVDEVQDLTTGLSQKIWQKIMILERVIAPP